MKRCALILCGLCAACGASPVNSGENYGNIVATPAGLVLTEAEHVGGWGRSDCSTCHHLENIHLVNRSALAIDIAAIRAQALAEGDTGCPACHGANGAP
ncbi:MAG: hypothetical protein HY543_03715 [Deltaproteobacteria bacterium]|nr:hypothetical protein [Deltaproteobacteria bacterium]